MERRLADLLPGGTFRGVPGLRSATMAAIRSSGTQPEMRVRRFLHGLGYRYRVDVRSLPGRPDIVFTKRRKVVFVHGCFWHGHECSLGRRNPRTRRAYWHAKIGGNMARDRRHRELLRNEGWDLLYLYECEVMAESTQAWRKRLLDFLGSAKV